MSTHDVALRKKSVAYYDAGKVVVVPEARSEARSAIQSFLDVLATATGRKTYYNSQAEQEAAEVAVHEVVWSVNRGLYGAMLTLPGVQHRAIQIGVRKMLQTPRAENDVSFLAWEQEAALIAYLCKQLTPPRLFKLFAEFRKSRINNRRTRSLILRSILGSGKKLPYWAIKYRLKLREALRHALGTGVACGVSKLTAASDPKASGSAHMARYIDRYLDPSLSKDDAYQCIAFILGGKREGGFTVPLLAARQKAATDIPALAELPVEVAFGLRSTYHRSMDKAAVLELTKKTLTSGQKLSMQRQAKDAGVEVELDASNQEISKLYVYALETGSMTPETRAAMDAQAARLAGGLPLRYERVGIVLDTSDSMTGTDDQKNRPLAVSLAMRDILKASATVEAFVESAAVFDENGLTRGTGDTSLGLHLARALRRNPEAIFILTDGYENAPEGRVNEIVRAARSLGNQTAIYQINPVLAAETAGVRRLSPEIQPIPVSRPEAMGLSMIRAALSQDIEVGIAGLLSAAGKYIGTRSDIRNNKGE